MAASKGAMRPNKYETMGLSDLLHRFDQIIHDAGARSACVRARSNLWNWPLKC